MFNEKYNSAYPQNIKIGGSQFTLIGHWNDLNGYYENIETGEIQSMNRLNGKTVYMGDSIKCLNNKRGWTLNGVKFKEANPSDLYA